MSDDTPYDRRQEPTRGPSLDIVAYQVGALQESLNRGMGSLEKTIDKGFEQVTVRMDRFERRLGTIEERQAFDAARLKALEEFRAEQDRRSDEERKLEKQRLEAAVDSSQSWKTARWLGAVIVALFTIGAALVAIINGFG